MRAIGPLNLLSDRFADANVPNNHATAPLFSGRQSANTVFQSSAMSMTVQP